MNFVVAQTQFLRDVPIRACHSETRSLDCRVKLFVSIFIFDRNNQILACECTLVWPERENAQVGHLSWLIQRFIGRECEFALRTQVKTEFNFFAKGISFRLRRYSPFIGPNLLRKVEAVNGEPRVVCSDRVLYCVVAIISQFQRELDLSFTQRLSSARVINTNPHRELVSRLRF